MAGGAGLLDLKRRIKSITNTRKITSAMGLIATSKLRRCRNEMTNSEEFFKSFNNAMKKTLSDASGSNIYVKGNGGSKKAFIAITSDTGLCGGYNSNIIIALVENLNGHKENCDVILVGEKGRGYLNRYKFNTLAEFVDIPDIPTIKEASILARKAREIYDSGEYKEVYMIYTNFTSSVKQEAKIKRLLPLSKEKETSHKYTNYELSPDEDIDIMLTSYLKSEMLHGLLHSKTSEQAARMTATDNATKNANDLIRKLNLHYNRIRQSAITQEITEIVGGSEAQR